VGLDPIQIREIRDLIAQLAAPEQGEARHTVILSTHILNEVEAICERIILINRGRKALDQPLSELVADGRSLEEVFARAISRDEADDAASATPSPGASSGEEIAV